MSGLQKTLKFINSEATSIHGNIRVSSLFTSESGEWKLGGFDILSSMKEDDAIIYVRFHVSLQSHTLTKEWKDIWQLGARLSTLHTP